MKNDRSLAISVTADLVRLIGFLELLGSKFIGEYAELLQKLKTLQTVTVNPERRYDGRWGTEGPGFLPFQAQRYFHEAQDPHFGRAWRFGFAIRDRRELYHLEYGITVLEWSGGAGGVALAPYRRCLLFLGGAAVQFPRSGKGWTPAPGYSSLVGDRPENWKFPENGDLVRQAVELVSTTEAVVVAGEAFELFHKPDIWTRGDAATTFVTDTLAARSALDPFQTFPVASSVRDVYGTYRG